MPPYSQMSPQQQQWFHQLLLQHLAQQGGGMPPGALPGQGQATQGVPGVNPLIQQGMQPQGQGFNLSALLPYLLGQGGQGGGQGFNLAQLLRGS